jgi:soluble lytic murein transglycosylase-like protein
MTIRLLALLWACLPLVAHASDSDYRLKLPNAATYRLFQPEQLQITELEQREVRRKALSRLPFAAQIEQAASAGGIEPELLHAVVHAESAYDPKAVSPKGALGLAQLLPATAQAYGVSDALKPADNLRASARHLRNLMNDFGDMALVLSAYNAGAGAVRRYGGIPPFAETRAYVPKVSGRYEELKRLGTVTPSPSPPSPYKLRTDSAELRLAPLPLPR